MRTYSMTSDVTKSGGEGAVYIVNCELKSVWVSKRSTNATDAGSGSSIRVKHVVYASTCRYL